MPRLLLTIFLGITIAVSLLLAQRFQHQEAIRMRTFLSGPRAIDELLVIELGGVRQKVLVRGKDKNEPLLLYLHGGPGGPYLGKARDQFPRLEEEFVVAYWAQRGTAGSYHLGMSALTVEQMLSDTQELVVWLTDHFEREALFLMGGSWGTTLGAITAARHPEHLIAYIGHAQGVNNPEGIAYSFRWALTKAREDGNGEAVDQLEALAEASPTPGHSPEDQIVLGNWIRHYGAFSHEWAEEENAIVFFVRSYLLPMWFSPDLSLWDQLQVILNPLFGARVFEEGSTVVVEDEARRIEVPVYILQGRHDVPTPTYLVRRWIRELEAPAGKELIIFEKSAHDVVPEEPEKFYATIARIRDEACRIAGDEVGC